MGENNRLLQDILRSEGDVGLRSVALEAYSGAQLVRAALDTFGDAVAISTAFGSSGLCLLHLAQQANPKAEAYYIDTGFAFEETKALISRWTDERTLRLRRILPVLAPSEQAARHGDRLWERDPDLCCELRKVAPNNRALAGKRLWITALRRDQGPSRASTPILQDVRLDSGQRLLKLAPLARWTRNDIWRYIHKHGLPYNALHDRGYPSIGCTHCTHAGTSDDERGGRWSGHAKTECGLHT
jgi:phosphoadenosine phosphosulfate reductase